MYESIVRYVLCVWVQYCEGVCDAIQQDRHRNA